MKHFYLLFSFLTLLTLGISCSNDETEPVVNPITYHINPIDYMSTTRPYPASNNHIDTPAPEGYEPVFMFHLGRHGSRFHTKDSIENIIHDFLGEAKSAQAFTPLGEELLAAFNKHHNMFQAGMLTPLGAREHQGIAERMFKRFPQLFNGDTRIVARSTKKSRCACSMVNFVNTLRNLDNSMTVTMDSAHYDVESYLKNVIRIYDTQPLIDAYNQRHPLDESFFAKNVFKASYYDNNKEKVAAMFPNIIEMMRYFYTEDHDTAIIRRVIPEKEWITFFKRYNFDVFESYRSTQPEYTKRLVGYTSLILDSLTTISDRQVSAQKPDTNLYLHFSHDTFIIPLLVMLNLDGTDHQYSAEEVYPDYDSTKMMPMGTNLQFIFYRNSQGHVLLKVLFNEDECKLGNLDTIKGCYYDWEKVKQYFAQRKQKYPLPL
ncbi:MAG: histidine-type phosphatase [Prevotella sp.]|nr:histidine-type phosphatase [Prevotella sp.]MCF0209268.1 histidine-type phosphatase [Bacteroidaceae bacterium]